MPSSRLTASAPRTSSVRITLRSVASPALAILLALFALSFFASLDALWNSSRYGEFGLTVDPTHLPNVIAVVPGSPADNAGIRVGDTVIKPRALHDRLVLTGTTPHPGERMTLTIRRGGQSRTFALAARPRPTLPVAQRILWIVKTAWLLVFLSAALILVLLSPSKMTWGFYLFALNLVVIFGPPTDWLSYLPSGWFIAMELAAHVIGPAGVAGFLVFCVRFPDNAPTEWRRRIDSLAPYVFVAIAAALIYQDSADALFIPSVLPPEIADAALFAIFILGSAVLLSAYLPTRGLDSQRTRRIVVAVICGLTVAASIYLILEGQLGFTFLVFAGFSVIAIFVLAVLALLTTYSGAREVERSRIKWVFLGLVCAAAAHATDIFAGSQLPPTGAGFWAEPIWVAVPELLYVVLPLTVAYAVIHHRVIDVRFVASRSLTFGVIAVAIGIAVAGVDWLFSTKLPNSRLEMAAYAGLALLVGFSLNAARERIGRTIDFILFRYWYQAQERMRGLDDDIRGARSSVDLFEPLTAGVVEAFSVASAALFERVEDAGFVRVAACGWPDGTIWHILSDDPLALSAGERRPVVDIDSLQWQERDIPAGVARPTIMLPIFSGKHVPALLLYGAHENGTGLAPDEIRSIRRLCVDAGPLYRKRPIGESERAGFLRQQVEPLGV